MIYLLAKMMILLVLAALFGAWIAHWWLRCRFDDVTRDYARKDGEWLTWRHAISEKMRYPLVDLEPMQNRLTRLDASIQAIKIPVPREVDLSPVQARLAALEQAVKAIEIPLPRDVDLAPVVERIDDLERAIGGIRIPQVKEVDLNSVRG